MAVNIETQITLVIKTNSLQRAVQICKLASFDGNVQIDTPKRRNDFDIRRAILSLLQSKFGVKEFSFSTASKLVKAELRRGSSTTRRILLLALDEGSVRRVKNGVYSFNKMEISGPEVSPTDEMSSQVVAPNAM